MPDLDYEQRHHLGKIATPAHVAQYCTRDLPDEAQWKPAKHLLYINKRIVEAATDAKQRFLQVAVSVRHGKSELISVYLIFWYLGMFPDRQVWLISYNEDKASQWGARVRDLMVQFGPELFGITVDGGTSASKTEWTIKGRRGGMKAGGIESSWIGSGPDLCVIDDPIKNDVEARSASDRKKKRQWYDGTLRSRMSPICTTILTMARWHEADLAGDLLADQDENMDQWEVINMPALASPTKAERQAEDFDFDAWEDELGRKMGEPLWPEKWPLALLERIRATISKRNPQSWDAQYQQDPTPLEGNKFKTENWVYVPSIDRSTLRLVRFWDLAATEGAGDWTVGMLVGMNSDNLTYVLDIVRGRWSASRVEQVMKATAERDGKGVPVRFEMERAGAGKSQLSTIVRLLTGWDVDGVKAEGKKEERPDNSGLTAQHQNKRVVIVGSKEDPTWTALVEEARVFPDGRHDDQVDALDGAFKFLVDGGPTTMMAEELLDVPLERMMAGSIGMRPGPALPGWMAASE